MERLRDAKEVRIGSNKINPSWVFKLLSSSPSLRKAWLLWSLDDDKEMMDDIPEMNLPNLDTLCLTAPPKSKITGGINLFFKNLKAPVLDSLQLRSISPKDLSSMKVDSTLKQLGLLDLQITDPARAKAAASTLIHSIQDWEELWNITFILPKTTRLHRSFTNTSSSF